MSTWLITGAAGFIGSHLAEALLERGERVVTLDLKAVNGRAGDIRNLDQCRQACEGVDFILHQAAQCSVPASIADPLTTHETNVTGFLNVLLAARDSSVKRVVYASSCAVYGDSKQLPNTEDRFGNFMSPYALSKFMDELYANMFAIETIGLRYFNVYGPRQDPNGPYAAVIPRWINAVLGAEKVSIFGDGETTRDFVFVEDVVRANLLAATVKNPEAVGQVYNVASGISTSLNTLYRQICKIVGAEGEPIYEDFRVGDIRHSSADISKIQRLLGFKPLVTLEDGLSRTIGAFRKR